MKQTQPAENHLSGNTRQNQMDADAEAYEELSKPQYESGCKFISELNLSPGDKVLDMGCGTGHITKYIADIVGSDGQVVGIDPDAARIKIAEEKYKEVSHLQFHVGSSVTGFPHDNELYYDVHVTTNAFHIQKTYQSLKPGGKLAIMCSDKVGPDRDDKHDIIGMHPLSQDELRKLFQEVGLFPNVVVKQFNYLVHFETVEIYKRWTKASSHQNLDDWDPAFVKSIMAEFVTFHDDGSVASKIQSICITASKD
jgi:SAM-dependent methyltransferase